MASTATKTRSGVKMTRRNKLALLRRAREIIEDPAHYRSGVYRRLNEVSGETTYCVGGALERAAYDLQLAQEGKPFVPFIEGDGLALRLHHDFGTASPHHRCPPQHTLALERFDKAIAKVEKGDA